MSFDLQLMDQRALVTGGTKGTGAAVVETLRGVTGGSKLQEIETWSVGANILCFASTVYAAAGETSRAIRLALLISATRRS